MDKEELHTLKINCKGERTVGKGNKGINVEKNNRFKKIKNKEKIRGRKKKGRKKKEKRKTPQNCKSPT